MRGRSSSLVRPGASSRVACMFLRGKRRGVAGDISSSLRVQIPSLQGHLLILTTGMLLLSQKNTVFRMWFFSPKLLKFGFFPVFLFGARVCLASVSVDDVRGVINVSSVEIPDIKVLK